MLSSFSSVTVSFKDGTSEGKTWSTDVSTFLLSSGVDLDGSSSTIDASADYFRGPAGFSTSGGLGKSFYIQVEVV